MNDPSSDLTRRPVRRRRRTRLLAAAAIAAVVAAAGLMWFQPWKLWVDDKVDEAAPAGAVPLAAPATPAAPASTTTAANPPTTAANPPTTDVALSPAAPVASSPPAPAPTVPATTVPATPVPPPTVPPTTAAVAPATPPPPTGGAFVSLDHGTSGTLVLLRDADGRQFVRLEDLDSSNGPDLYLYLSTNPVDGPEGAFDDDVVNLGRLKGNIGSQNYEVPDGTDLGRFASVVIWCDRFDSAFGAAPLT